MKTRKEFLETVMKMANLKDLREADAAARAERLFEIGEIEEEGKPAI